MVNTAEQIVMDFEVETKENPSKISTKNIPLHDKYLLEQYKEELDKSNLSKEANSILAGVLLFGEPLPKDVHPIARKVANAIVTNNEPHSIVASLEYDSSADAAYKHLKNCTEKSCKIALSELIGSISSEVKRGIRIRDFKKSK